MTTPSPPIPTFSDGVPAHANLLNALGSNISNLYNFSMGGFLNAPPLCIVSQSTAQSIPTNTFTAVNFQAAVVNTPVMWVASVPSTITVTVAGVYLITGQILWGTTSATGGREVDLAVNGSAQANAIARSNSPGSNTYDVAVDTTAFFRLAANSTIQMLAWQSSGGALSTVVGVSTLTTSMSALWVSP